MRRLKIKGEDKPVLMDRSGKFSPQDQHQVTVFEQQGSLQQEGGSVTVQNALPV